MKKAIIIVLSIFTTFNLFSQTTGGSFCIGGMGIAKNTWLFNNNVLDDKNSSQEMDIAFGSSFGLNMSIYFTQNIGIGLDVLYATHNQKYNGVTDGITNTPYKSKFHLSSLDLPLYLRLSTNGGAYFELGSYFSVITASQYSSDATGIYTALIPASFDAKANTTSFSIAPLLGMGIDINLTDNLILNPGFRFSYGVTDLKGVDGRGKTIDSYSVPEKTNSLSGGLLIGLVYRFDI